MNSVCVFCGSNSGVSRCYEDAARATGRALARVDLRVIYGGGKVGLMGILADAVLSAGGNVTGVMPRALLEREIAHRGLSDLRVVESMHQRKELMAGLADAFIALPGGAGTLEEIFEQWTWAQLGIHEKPCGFLNVNGYFDPLLAVFEKMVAEGFMAQGFTDMLAVENNLEALLSRFRAYQPPARKWATNTGPTRSTIIQSSEPIPVDPGSAIRIAAALITDEDGRILLVRKRNTQFFMQPGGKLREGESSSEALARELKEELGCTLVKAEFLGVFSAPAANEKGQIVEAALFRAETTGEIHPRAEIADVAWVGINQKNEYALAPLTKVHVFPLVTSRERNEWPGTRES